MACIEFFWRRVNPYFVAAIVLFGGIAYASSAEDQLSDEQAEALRKLQDSLENLTVHPKPYLLKDNAEQLNLVTFQLDCPVSQEFIENAVKSVFRRARIEPLEVRSDVSSARDLRLSVFLACYDEGDSTTSFLVQSDFTIYANEKLNRVRLGVGFQSPGVFKTDQTNFQVQDVLLSAIQNVTEASMEEYIVTNFE